MNLSGCSVLIASILIGILSFLNSSPINAQTIQLTVVNGAEIRCADDSLITVLITPNAAGTFTEINLDWGDGNISTITPGNSLQLSHTFSTAMFYEECDYSCGPNPFINGFCFQISVLAQYSDIEDENVSKIITYKIPPRPNFNANPTIACTGNEVTFNNSTCPDNDEAMEYFWQFTSIDTDTLANPVYTFLAAGTYSVTLTATNECGTQTIIRSVQVLDPAEAVIEPDSGFVDIMADTLNVCLDGASATVQLNGTTSLNETSYGWIVSPSTGTQWVTEQDTSFPLLQFTDPGEYLVILTVDNNCMQVDFDTIMITVVSGVSLQLDSQPDACLSLDYSPSPLNLDAVYIVNGVPYSPTDFPMLLTQGFYTVTAELSNLCGMQMLNDNFEVSEPEEIQILSPGDTTICAGSGDLLLIASSDGGVWSGQVPGLGDTITFTPDTEGSFQAIYTKGLGQCERSDTIEIQVVGIAVSAEDIDVCSGITSGIPLIGTPAGGMWTSPDCPSCITGDSFYLVPLNGQFSAQLEYTVMNANGCSSSEFATLSVITPVADFSIDDPLCSNLEIDVSTNDAIGDLSWSLDNIPTGPPPYQLTGGMHQLKLIAVLGTCRDSISIPFEVLNPPSAPNFTVDVLEGCDPLISHFIPEFSAQDGVDYSWIFDGGIPGTWLQYNPPDSVIFSNPSDTDQVFTVALSAVNVCGSANQEKNIIVLAQPVADIGIDSVLSGCSPHTITLTNRSNGTLDECNWVLGDGTTLTGCNAFFTHTFFADDSITSYLIELEAINQCGSSQDVDTITVLPAGVDAFFNVPMSEVCPGTPVQFTDASTPIPSSWTWTFGNGMISNDPNPLVTFSEPNDTIPVVLRVSTGCGYDTIQHFIYTADLPLLDFEVNSVACENSAFSISNLSPTDYFKYIWEFSDGRVDSVSFEPKHVFDMANTSQSITLTVIDFDQMCTNSLTKEIEVRERPIAAFDAEVRNGCGPLEVVFQNLSQNANQFLWDFGDGQFSAAENAGHFFNEGQFDISLIASDGVCDDTAMIAQFIRVDPCEVYVPNVFSPNSDGNNDRFTVFGTSNFRRINLLRIFSNWGGVVFEEIDVAANDINGWDGTVQGTPLDPAVFVYLIEVEFEGGTIRRFSGDVTLVR